MAERHDIFEALFVGDDVDTAELGAAMRAAQHDATLRAQFDELALADRELHGDFEARAGEAMFLAALDEMLADERPVEPPISLDHARAARAATIQRWALAAVALLAVGGALAILSQQNNEFQARSATAHDDIYAMPHVDVFCVERDAHGEVTFRGPDDSALATVRCPLTAEIKLAVRNEDPKLRYVSLFAVQQDGEPRWYGPSPARHDAYEIGHGSELIAVGETIHLEVNHRPGTVRVLGVFTEEPMTWQQLNAWTSTETALWDGRANIAGGVVVRSTFEVSQ